MSGNQVILGNAFESQMNLHDIETRVPISAVILTPDFSNLTEFKQLQIPDTKTINTETLHNTTRKIANSYIEFKFHLSTLRKKNRTTFEQGCSILI